MAFQFDLSSVDGNNVAEIFSEVWDSGKITEHERMELRSALLNGDLSSDDHAAIDRLVHAVKRGWLSLG
ncbi:MAG: hypothetical protein AAF685_07025 [Cyanobacteria bacterium P01_C01_bin.89]